MFRHSSTRWLLLTLVLIAIGLWPAAVAPIAWASAGADHILAATPGPVLALVAIATWIKHRPAPAVPTAD